MTYFSAFVFAIAMFSIVVLWSVVEFILQNRKDEFLDSPEI